jgi:large subunit ribosomal protein L13e
MRDLTNNATAAGIPRKFARTIGISVDPRRQNLSEEGLKANVERLQEYRKRIILFPRRNGKTKEGDASAEDVKSAKTAENIVARASVALPIKNVVTFEEGAIGDYKGEENAYRKLRDARSEARLVGVREKRAKAKADEADSKKK